jgi:hypothetical protein
MHIHMYVYMTFYAHTLQRNVFLNIYTYIHMCMCIYIYVCMCVCTNVLMSGHVFGPKNEVLFMALFIGKFVF